VNRRQRLLTEEEYEVLLSAADGEVITDTAERIGCSTQTIARRRGRVLEKLRSPTMAGAVARAFHLGILIGPGQSPR
jgi:DNA-binding NarL/FixJ family response regulator